jgi:hypothetical protein
MPNYMRDDVPSSHSPAPLRKLVTIFLLLIVVPIGISAGRYYWVGDHRGNWQTADRASAGLLPAASSHPEALIRVYAARTVRWRSIFAVHTWIVVKEQGAANYSRYDYTAWGEPIRSNGFAADGRWFGETPETIVAVDGDEAARLIPRNVSLGGYLGLTVGWVEGIELNFFGAVLGIDVRRPALKFPGIGRLGLPIV